MHAAAAVTTAGCTRTVSIISYSKSFLFLRMKGLSILYYINRMCNDRTNNNITYAAKDDNNVNTTVVVTTVDRITISARPEMGNPDCDHRFQGCTKYVTCTVDSRYNSKLQARSIENLAVIRTKPILGTHSVIPSQISGE